MPAVARERLPRGTPLYQADMSGFDLATTFDVVVCSYQAVNHLLDFSARRDFFCCVHRHLNDGGMFLRRRHDELFHDGGDCAHDGAQIRR